MVAGVGVEDTGAEVDGADPQVDDIQHEDGPFDGGWLRLLPARADIPAGARGCGWRQQLS